MDESGEPIDFANTAASIWNSRDLTGKVPANDLRKQAMDDEHKLSQTVRKNLKEYVATTSIPVPGENAYIPMHADGWDTCDQCGCGTQKIIESHTHPCVLYGCQKGDCVACEEKGYSPPLFEIHAIESHNIIQFSKCTTLSQCTVPGHGGTAIGKFNEEPKLRCT